MRAATTIEGMDRIDKNDLGMCMWLRAWAGWTPADIAYYNECCAFPEDVGISEWTVTREDDYRTFLHLYGDAELAGVSVRSRLVRECGVERWKRGVQGATLGTNRTMSLSSQVVCRFVHMRVSRAATYLRLRRYREAVEVIRDSSWEREDYSR
jgi:hypothetical protein